MTKEEILNKYIDLIDKGYCNDCNELNCIDNFPHAKIAHTIRELQQENQELKLELSGYRQAILKDKEMLGLKEDNDKLKKQIAILDKTTIQLISKLDIYDVIVDERDELKKQLEEYKRLGFKHLNDKCNKLENQQKEFVKYLEDKLCIANEVLDDPEEDEEVRGYVLARKFMLEEILSKHQEIMGVINNYVKDKR